MPLTRLPSRSELRTAGGVAAAAWLVLLLLLLLPLPVMYAGLVGRRGTGGCFCWQHMRALRAAAPVWCLRARHGQRGASAVPPHLPPSPPAACLAVCRRVEAVNISPFIANLPFGKDTTCFDTPDASGSTSQVPPAGAARRLGKAVWCGNVRQPHRKHMRACQNRAAAAACSAAVLAVLLTPPPALPRPTPALPRPCLAQAANIQEALEVGAQTLLVDEDTSATNCEP